MRSMVSVPTVTWSISLSLLTEHVHFSRLFSGPLLWLPSHRIPLTALSLMSMLQNECVHDVPTTDTPPGHNTKGSVFFHEILKLIRDHQASATSAQHGRLCPLRVRESSG